MFYSLMIAIRFLFKKTGGQILYNKSRAFYLVKAS